MKKNILIYFLTVLFVFAVKSVNGQEAKNPFNSQYENTLFGHIEAIKGKSELRKIGFEALSEYWTVDTIQETLVQLYKNSTYPSSIGYLEILGQIRDDSLLPIFTPFLSEEDSRAVRFSCEIIARHGYSKAASVLRESLLNRKIDDATYWLIDALEQISTVEALTALKESRENISTNDFLNSYLEEAIQRLELFNQANSKKKFIRSILKKSVSRRDFYWSCRKILQNQDAYVSLEFINRIYNKINNREEVIDKVLNPEIDTRMAEKELFLTYGRFASLLNLRKRLGDKLTDSEELAWGTLYEEIY